MPTLHTQQAYFSISLELISTGQPLTYDLYINSSVNPSRIRYVKICRIGEVLTKNRLKEFKEKYHQLYVSEKQRSLFLKSLTGSDQSTDVKKAEVIKDSAIKYLNTIFNNEKEFSTELLNETVQGCRDSVESMVNMLQTYSINDLQKMIAQLSYHDFYTYDHSINVSMYCINIYKQLRPDAKQEDLILAGLGGLLHDLGKIKLPTQLINKPGELTDEEFAQIKKHPEYGYELLHTGECQCAGVNLETISRIIIEHHENFNGTGYPNKLKGEEIHVLSRITAIADFFDAITTHRSYHEALSIEKALEVMSKSIGRKIDPYLFEIFRDITLKKSNSQPKTNISLPDDFDPCQPHAVLPFQEGSQGQAQGQTQAPSKKDGVFGKVIVEQQKVITTIKKDKDNAA